MKLRTLGVILGLTLTAAPAALAAQITVAPPSGTTAHTAINSAISSVASGATASAKGVVLLTAGTYHIGGPIVMKSNVVLKGAGDSTIIYATASVCNSDSAQGYITATSISNFEISHLQFKSSATGTTDGGHGDYRNCIRIRSSSSAKIHDILFTHYLYSDGVRVSSSSGIDIFNCRIRAGHDGISFLSSSSGCRAHCNDIDIRTNTGIRVDNSKNIELDHNVLYGLHGSGWCVFEMENSLSGVDIHHNILHDYKGSSGSWAVSNVHASGSVSFHDNVLWNVGSIGYGTTSNNTINPSDKNVDSWIAKGYGCKIDSSAPVTCTTLADCQDPRCATAPICQKSDAGVAPKADSGGSSTPHDAAGPITAEDFGGPSEDSASSSDDFGPASTHDLSSGGGAAEAGANPSIRPNIDAGCECSGASGGRPLGAIALVLGLLGLLGIGRQRRSWQSGSRKR